MLNKIYFLTAIIIISVSLSYAQVPRLINYQGYLTDANKTPITAILSIQFKIYSALTGGTQLWSETQTVTVTDGLFND